MEIKLEQLKSADSYKKELEYNASILAMSDESFLVPSQIDVYCTESKLSASQQLKAKCLTCPLSNTKEKDAETITLMPTNADHSQVMLNLIQKSESIAKKSLHKLIGCPHPTKCRDVQVEEVAQQAIKPTLIETHLDDVKAGHLSVQTKMFYLGDDKLDVSSKYKFKGTMVYDTETRHSIPLAYESKRTKDSIDSFKVEDHIEQLKEFRVEEESTKGISMRLRNYFDFVSNRVTRIRKREHIIMAFDTVYHSVSQFRFNGRLLEKGWLEATVVGDTSTGKTETIRGLARYYGAGEFISSAETASRAGLLGGIRSISGQQVIEWGKLPKNDRGAAIIDETDTLASKTFGASIMAELTDVRRSGIATITKTVSGSAPARTRIIWISNKPNGGNIDPSSEGIRILPELFGASQDVARVDLAVIALKDDVSPEDINHPFPEDYEPVDGDEVYTREACNARVLFAWTRKPEQIKISKEVEELINAKAKELSETYSLEIPLVADIKIKLARAAVSLACQLFSTDDTYENVIVKRHHVEYMANWIASTYKLLKYDIFSKRAMRVGNFRPEDLQILKSLFRWEHEAQALLEEEKMTDHVLADAFNTSLSDVGEQKEKLKRAGVFKQWNNGQRVKTQAFTRWLTNFVNERRKSDAFFTETDVSERTTNGTNG